MLCESRMLADEQFTSYFRSLDAYNQNITRVRNGFVSDELQFDKSGEVVYSQI